MTLAYLSQQLTIYIGIFLFFAGMIGNVMNLEYKHISQKSVNDVFSSQFYMQLSVPVDYPYGSYNQLWF